MTLKTTSGSTANEQQWDFILEPGTTDTYQIKARNGCENRNIVADACPSKGVNVKEATLGR
jgi:hypothetical protein